MTNSVAGRDRALDLDLSVELHRELAALDPGPDPRKAAEDAAALEKSQAWLADKQKVVADREKFRAVLHDPQALPADKAAAAESLEALPRAW